MSGGIIFEPPIGNTDRLAASRISAEGQHKILPMPKCECASKKTYFSAYTAPWGEILSPVVTISCASKNDCGRMRFFYKYFAIILNGNGQFRLQRRKRLRVWTCCKFVVIPHTAPQLCYWFGHIKITTKWNEKNEHGFSLCRWISILLRKWYAIICAPKCVLVSNTEDKGPQVIGSQLQL